MARYPFGSYGRRGRSRRRWAYIITAALIIAVVIVVILRHRSSGKNEDELVGTNLKNATVPPEPKRELEPAPELIEEGPEPASEPDPKATEIIAEAMALISEEPSKVIGARDRLNEVLAIPVSRQQRAFVKGQLSELADKWLFSRTIFPQDTLCSTYKVKPGDQLRTIGRQHKMPYEILMEINNIPRAEALQAGETIKVINGPFHARVYRSTFTMDLYLQNTFVRSFPAGLGKPGMETPTGLWLVKLGGKLISPTWTDPVTSKTYQAEDPDYPLGSRWIGLEGLKGDAKGRTGFAIHGTKAPHQIGTADSQGCIRLHNGDAILLYNLLEPGYSQVEVVE